MKLRNFMCEEERKRTADRGHDYRCQNEHCPLEGAEHRVENKKNPQNRDRNDDRHALIGAFLGFRIRRPTQR